MSKILSNKVNLSMIVDISEEGWVT